MSGIRAEMQRLIEEKNAAELRAARAEKDAREAREELERWRKRADKANLFDVIRRLCGYVENGSDTVVTICQDDATKEWMVKVGAGRQPRYFHGPDLNAALHAADEGTPHD